MHTLGRAMLVALLLGAAAVTLPATATPANAASCVQIYRIYYNSPGTDTRTNTSLNGEWIQLKNNCSTRKSLTSWKIVDAANHIYKFGTYYLAAGSSVRIHTGKGTNTATNRYWGSGAYIWNNTGAEKALLRNSLGTLMDSCSYTGTSLGYKYC